MRTRAILSEYSERLKHWALGTLTFGAALLVYIKTLSPTVAGVDSAEWQLISTVWGIPHITGYPLYIILGRAFIALPFGSVAYRMNFMSAFFAAASVLYVYLIVRHLLKDKAVAMTSALLFAFSETLWSQAVIAEVYTLSAFFLAAVIYYLLLWRDTKSSRWFYLAVGLYALSFGNHLMMITFLPAIAAFVLMTEYKAFFDWRKVLVTVLFIAIGASLYLYLPIRSAQRPIFDWGREWGYVPETWKGFKDYISGAMFKRRMFAIPEERIPDRIIMYWNFLKDQFTLVGVAAALLGAWECFKSNLRILIFLALAYLGNLAFALTYDIFDIFVYFIPSYLILSILAAYALLEIKRVLVWGRSDPDAEILQEGHSFLRAAWATLVSLLLLALPLFEGRINYYKNDRSRDHALHNYAQAFYKGLDKGAVVLLTGWEKQCTLRYFQYVEKWRPDVLLEFAWKPSWPGRARKYLDSRPIFLNDYDATVGKRILARREDLGPSLAEVLGATAQGKIVLLAVEDDASRRLRAEDVAQIRTLGGKFDLRWKWQQAHALIGVKGAPPGSVPEGWGSRPVYLRVKKGQYIGKTKVPAPVDIRVWSAGFDAGNYGAIIVNGKNVAFQGTGYHVVVLDPKTGKVEKSLVVNTSDPPARYRVLGLYEDGILRLARPTGRQAEHYELTGETIDLSRADARRFLLEGWEGPEDWGRWGLGAESRLLVRLPEGLPYTLSLKVKAGDDLEFPPTVKVYFNDQLLEELEIPITGDWQTYRLKIPAALVQAPLNTLRFVYGGGPISERRRVVGFAHMKFEKSP